MSSGLAGIRFYKMSGSGNDFVVVDARREPYPALEDPATIERVCRRGTGVGADGIVLLAPERGRDFRMVYYNADGSRASMCGNAALCCTALVSRLDRRMGEELAFETDAGLVTARVASAGPQIDLAPVDDVRPTVALARPVPGSKVGFVMAGVPHATVLVDDVERTDVVAEGRAIRTAPELRPAGANANFVSGARGAWRIRTYERGVEGETLACGTGAVASAILIASWGLDEGPIRLETRSGRTLAVTLRREGDRWIPSLAGEGRLVFEGSLGEL